jgi:hypothetical protein
MLPWAVGRKGRKMGGKMNTLTWRGLAVGKLSALNKLPIVGQIRGEFRPRQTRQLPGVVDLKGRFLFLVVVKC